MSMFTVTGQVINTFEAPARMKKDAPNEVEFEAKPKVQLLGDMPVPGGQKRMELVTLSCEDQTIFDSLKGKTVAVPIGVFSPNRGVVIYYIPKGAMPVEVLPFPGPKPAGGGGAGGNGFPLTPKAA
jgi:hypothetical protein